MINTIDENYFDSAKGMIITKARTIRELAEHGVDKPEDIAQFYKQVGDKEMYKAQDVLAWLGY